MKVKFTQNIASIYGGFSAGEVVDTLPDSAAKDYIAAGYAEEVKAPKPKPKPKKAEEEAEE